MRARDVFKLARWANVLRLLSGCRDAHAESAVGSASMRGLRRADLGSEEIAYRTAQNLYSLHSSVRVTDPLVHVRFVPIANIAPGSITQAKAQVLAKVRPQAPCVLSRVL